MPKRDLARAEIAPARISVASPPPAEQPLPAGEYALALVDSVLYLARAEGDASSTGPHHARLRLAETQLAMAFGGPPFHSTLHLEHPAVGRLVVSLPAIEFATLTEAAVVRVRSTGGW
ncbi:MAG: hypothetical protein ACXVKA_01755 [Acidimicrobiia bacterium]